jgi:hypothetical protein
MIPKAIVVYEYCTKSISAVKWSMTRIGGVMVSVLALSAVDRWFEVRLGQIKNYNIGVCCFSAKHETLRGKRYTTMAIERNMTEKNN